MELGGPSFLINLFLLSYLLLRVLEAGDRVREPVSLSEQVLQVPLSLISPLNLETWVIY